MVDPTIDRFWRKVDRSAGPSSCWPWRGSVSTGIPCRVSVAGMDMRGRRMAWTLTKGAIPLGQIVLVTCLNKLCCNPAHLRLGTYLDERQSRPSYQNRIARFWDRIERPAGGCWEWKGLLTKSGYGNLRWDGRGWLAHRLAWTLARGPVPSHLFVCHHCDNPKCCNPEHLFIGTQTDNMHDMFAKGRRIAARGERASKAKLTASEVRQMRADFAGGERQTDLSQKYGMSKGAVSAIVHGRHWKHLLPMRDSQSGRSCVPPNGC